MPAETGSGLWRLGFTRKDLWHPADPAGAALLGLLHAWLETTAVMNERSAAMGHHGFHAYVEVDLGDCWYICDASGTGIPMGFVRIGTRPAAADVPFATLFGGVTASHAPMVRAIAVEDARQRLERPRHCDLALSTDGCRAAQAG